MFLDVADGTSIGNFFVPRYRIFLLEVNGVGAVNSVANTLCESSELVGEGCFPNFFLGALYEVAVFLGLTGDWVSVGICFRDCDVVCRISVLG